MAGRVTLAAISLAMVALIAPVAGAGPGVGEARAATTCASGQPLYGVDVSRYQGTIDWRAVADSGIRFGMARIGDGLTIPDAFFEANYAGMLANGITPGSYLFWEPAQDPVAQANLILNALARVGFDIGDIPPTIDVEVTGGQSPATIAARLHATVTTIENAIGVRPLIYTSPRFWNETLNSGAFADLPLWIAHWRVACPSTPVGWSTWSLWQTSDAGSVPGITGPVDLNQTTGLSLPVYTGAPLFSPLPDLEVRGMGPTRVGFAPRAVGYRGAAMAATCSPASGSVFPLGTSLVTCSVGSLFGFTTESFVVTVRQPAPPAFTSPLPTDITTIATGPAGRHVTWAPMTATEASGASIPVSCLPGPDAQFRVGLTLVTCRATDSFARQISASFTVSVSPPPSRHVPR